MSSSTKITESPRTSKFAVQYTRNSSSINDFKDGNNRNFTSPVITSSPVRLNMYATPPKPHVFSPRRRYSLSDIATPPRITKRDPIRSSFQHNISGPLLASTKFNVNLSTYEETKSPGLARRIVQYNQEAEMEKEKIRPPTHQAKYGSPGLFPIVHLFKKSPPTLEQRPKRVKVRISSPGYARQQSEDYKLKLLEGIVKPRTLNRFSHTYQDHAETSTSTRSVLDALREISRKRIHTNEEYNSNDDTGKRQRTDFLNVVDTNKRTRDETSPHLDSPTSPSKPVSKRACVYDEYAASCSSTVYSYKNSDLGSKRKSISTSTVVENPKETKQVKLINVETQTNPEEKDKSTEDVEEPVEKSQGTIERVGESQKKRDSPLKIFDDAPLERIRKNRLAALMGSLTGKDPVLTPKPTFSSIMNGNKESDHANTQVIVGNEKTEKPLISILSTNKLSQKSEKHVHFSVPEVSASFSNSESSVLFTTPSMSNGNVSTAVNKTSDMTASPVMTVTPSLSVGLKSSESNSVTQIGSNSLSKPSAKPTFTSQNSDQPKFSVHNTGTPLCLSPITTNSLTTPQFSFGTSSNNSTSVGSPLNLSTQPLTSSPKVGGFKFNLSPAKTTVSQNTPTTVPDNPITVANNPTTMPSLVPKAIEAKTGKSSANSADLSTTMFTNVATTSTGLTFGTITTASSMGPVSSSSASPFQFGFSTDSGMTPRTDIQTKENTNIVTAPTFSFGSTTTKPLTGTTNSTTTSQENKTLPFNFSSTNSTSSATTVFASSTFNFSTPKQIPASTTVSTNVTKTGFVVLPNNAAESVITFGASTDTTGFQSPTSFGISTPSTLGTSSALTQISTTTTPNSFRLPTTAISTFGSPVTSINGFGTTTSSSAFGPSASSNAFGIPNNSNAFGSSNTFGSKTTSSTASFPTTTISSGFSAFATLNKAPNNLDSANPSSGTFGSSSTSIFGSTKPVTSFSSPTTQSSNAFGNSAPAFQPPSASTFGQNNAPPPYGTTTNATFGTNTFNSVTTTSSSVFGGSTGFGTAANNSSNIFGGSVTTQASGFGTSNSIFAPASTVSPFENIATTTNSFMSSNAPVFSFGAKTTTATGNGFGTNTTTNAFGSMNAPSFGTSNTFGSNNNAFGNSSAFGASSTPSFGAATTQPNGFAPQNNSFSTPSQGFGVENKPVFGNTTTPSFGTNPTSPVFGSTAPSVGFGTSNPNPAAFGANTNNSGFGKQQTNTFGTVMPNNFSSTSGGFGPNQTQANPPFGSSNPAVTNSSSVFSFGGPGPASKPAVFSFGNAPSSSSEPPKPNYNFTGGGGAPAFGASSSFSSSVGPSFGAPNPNTTQFGANTGAAPNMFNIGSGSPSTRNRTMIRAKRRN